MRRAVLIRNGRDSTKIRRKRSMRLPGIVRIIRPVNAVVAGLAAILGYGIAAGNLVTGTILLFSTVFLITAAGNSINDYFDADIDRINRPDRPIPSGEVLPGMAWNISIALFSCGILIAVFTNPVCFGIAVFNTLLLVLYGARLKRTFVAGNLAVSYLSASIFLFGGAYLGYEGIIRVLPVVLVTFFAMLSREILKTAEDVEGDAASGADTVPVRYGVRSAVLLSAVFALCAVAGSIYPVLWWGNWYLGGILIVDSVIIFAAVRPVSCIDSRCIKKSGATTLLKAGMFGSLVVFTLAALFA
jgi:geranylgeranylglycerol-phosphate geranylgeranyltransferase